MGLTTGSAAGYRGGVINTGVEDILVLPAVTVVALLPGPALRDGFSHVLSLPIVVPEALRRLSGQLLRQRRSGPLQTLRRLLCQLLRQRQPLVDLSIYSGACLPFSPVLVHSSRVKLKLRVGSAARRGAGRPTSKVLSGRVNAVSRMCPVFRHSSVLVRSGLRRVRLDTRMDLRGKKVHNLRSQKIFCSSLQLAV